ncbi:MAG: hypothetical protein ACRDRK_23685 [Pseudonocardia sp.]
MAEDLPEHAVDTEFELVRRGYDQQQVDGHLRRLDAETRILMADREAAVDQAAHLGRELDESRARADRLRAQVRSLVHAPQTVQGMSERVRSMLRMAQDEVADMLTRSEAEVVRRRQETDRYLAELIATAHANADAIGAAARVEADAIGAAARVEAERSAAADAQARAQTERECDAARAVVAAERAESERQIAEAAEQARGERGQDWSEAEIRRALIEEDFAIAMDQRRSEALAELTAGRAEAKRREALILATAADHSRDMIDRADRTVAEADRAAKAMAAGADHTAKETLAHANHTAQQTVAHANNTAQQTVAHADHTATEMVAEAQRRVEELIAVRGLVAEQLRNGRGVMEVALSGLEAQVAGESAALAAGQGHNSRGRPDATTNGTAADRNARGVEGESPKASSAPSPRPRTTDQLGVLIR